MIGALLSPLFGMVGSLASAGGSLAAAGAKMAYKAVAGSADAVDDAVDKKGFGFKKGKGDADSGGGKGKKGKKGKKESSSMFGGLDLGAVESAIQGPMGPPEPEQEVKGGVYKQIFAVNEKMLSSLMNIENSIRMLLSIEYEKIQGMMSDDRQTTIDEGETDEPEGEKKKGLLGRAASGIGGMLGSAYSKAKGGLGSNLFKALGIGALIIAFKKYPDEIRAGVKSLLVFFKDTYDYFTAEDFTFQKFKTDFVDKFFPRMKEILLGGLESLWDIIKGVIVEFALGAKGDKSIRQERKKLGTSTGALKEMGETLDFDSVFKEVGDSGVYITPDGVGVSNFALDRLGVERDSAQSQKLESDLDTALRAMAKLSRESDGRIQFKGFPDISGATGVSMAISAMQRGTVSIKDVLNAIPIIDGKVSSIEELNSFGLFENAGITKQTDEDTRETISDNLSDMSEIIRMLNSVETDRDHLLTGNDGKIKFDGEFYTDAEAKARVEELRADNLTLGAFSDKAVFTESGEVIKPSAVIPSMMGTNGVSESTKSLMSVAEIAAKATKDAAAAVQDAARANNSGGNMTTLNSTNDMSSNQQIFQSLNGNPTNGTVMADRARKLENR